MEQGTMNPVGSIRFYNDDYEFRLTRTQALDLACEIVTYLQKNTAHSDKPIPGEVKAVVEHFMAQEALERQQAKEAKKRAPRGWKT